MGAVKPKPERVGKGSGPLQTTGFHRTALFINILSGWGKKYFGGTVEDEIG